MSIQSEINRISANVSDALDAIEEKGVTIPSGSTSDDLADLIGQIQQGGGGSVVVVDTVDSHGGTIRAITAAVTTPVQQATPSISVNSSTGLITASATQEAGMVSAGTKSATEQLSTQAAATITPSTSQQTAVAAGKYTTGAVVVNAMPSGTAGTPTATKGSVSNHSVSITPSVTNATGYITGSTKTGTAVSVSASELVSGTLSITSVGTADVTNYASVNVQIPFQTYYTGSSAPSSSLGTNGDIYLQT